MGTKNYVFKNAQVGDRVYDLLKGWGTIVNINPEDNYPIYVNSDIDSFCTFTYDGKRDINDKNPTLFWDEIKFDIPKKPFNLENELKQLEVQEFKTAERNYFLTWDNAGKSIYYDIVGNNEQPDIKYFTENSVKKFMENVKDKKISKEQFFEAYKKVFGGETIC